MLTSNAFLPIDEPVPSQVVTLGGFSTMLMISILIGAITILLLHPDQAMAWGPGVHTITSLTVLQDIGQILPSIGAIIGAYSGEYLYGCLAADFFIGKGRGRRASHPHNWTGGFKFLREAGDEREAAYAYGFLSHLAADVIAHNFFVPSLMISFTKRRMGHLYWEINSDYLAGPAYTKIAKDILSIKHLGCDGILVQLAEGGRKRVRPKRRLYAQTVRISEYLFDAHPLLFSGKTLPRKPFYDYLAAMIGLSCRLVQDFLRDPESSPCLQHDPLGRHNLGLAKRTRRLPKRPRASIPLPGFMVDGKLRGR